MRKTKCLERAERREQEHHKRVVAELERIFTTETRRRKIAEAMLQRAYDHLWDGRAEACDALLEWLPEKMVRRMLDAWLDDQEPRDESSPPLSKWHAPKFGLND